MPLKHATETFLIVLLGIAIALAAFAARFLPPVVEGWTPWGVAFLVSVLYPLALHPLLRRRRADYAFRVLHLFPLLIFVLAAGLEVLGKLRPEAAAIEEIYRWGWTLLAVGVGYLLMAVYCVRVMRQRRARIVLLLLLFLPFAGFAVSAERLGLNPLIAASIRDPERIPIFRRWIAQLPGVVSQDAEEQWKLQQQEVERRAERLELEDADGLLLEGVKDADRRPLVSSAVPLQGKAMSAPPALAGSKAPPPGLAPSGFSSEVALPIILAGYTGLLHWRARRRAQRRG